QADGAGHHGTSNRRDVPGEEDEHEGAAHDVEERDGAEAASLEEGHPPGGDAHADAHDEVQHEELDADAGEVAEVSLGEELGPPAASEAEKQDPRPDHDEAFHQDHQQLGRDDGKRDDDDERGYTGHEAREEAIQETQI